MNAISGLMVSPEALMLCNSKGKLAENLRKIRESNKQAGNIVDAIELVEFKKVVKEKAKEAGDGGNKLGNDMLGVFNAANGPAQFGFQFTNKKIEKDFKDLAFKEGVIKPMAEKMRENGEEPFNVDNIATSVLNEFTEPKTAEEVEEERKRNAEQEPFVQAPKGKEEASSSAQSCAWLECTNSATKRCGACKKIYYCCPEHQRQHWPVHKIRCAQLKENGK
jgi:hypothetical protein